VSNPSAKFNEFLKAWSGDELLLADDADVFDYLGVEGDDAFEFMYAFAETFEVNIDAYRWYFHHGEEGLFNIGGIFCRPPYARVARIPITPNIFTEAITTKRWPLKYPEHHLPKYRYDMLVNQSFVALTMIPPVLWMWRLLVR
jgi:hypothetical protein